MDKNILIIGHTTGIGKDIYSRYKNIDGVSKSTGFDINTNISKEYDFSKYDCIVLNAIGLDSYAQIKTFFNIIENKTFNKSSLLIVMSSISAFKENLDTLDKIKYSTEKMSINKAVRNLNNLGYNTSSICPSYVDTEWNKKRTDVLKLDTSKVGDLVDTVIKEYFNNSVLINEIVFQQR